MYQWQPSKWLKLATVGAGLPFLAAGIIQTKSLVQDVSSRAMAAAGGPIVAFDGRDATVSGEGASKEALETLKKNVGDVYGVRVVDVTNVKVVVPAPVTLISPTVESITTTEATPVIKGTWPEGTAKSLEVTAAGKSYVLGKDAELTSSSGNWTLKPSAPLAAGSYDVSVAVSDGGSATAATATPGKIVIEAAKAVEPAKPAPLPLAAPTVTAITTNVTQPEIKGTYPVEAAKLTVNLGPTAYELGKAPELTADKSGNWILKPSKPLADGTIEASVKVESADGAVTATSAAAPIVIDTVPPAAPSLTKPTADSVWPYAITGKWDETPGSTLALDFNNKTYVLGKEKEVISDGHGAFTFVPTDKLAPGKYDLGMTVTDAAGNVSKTVQAAAVVVAEPAPAPEPVALAAPTIDTIKSEKAAPVITGTWQAGVAKSLSVTLAGKTYQLGKDFDLLSDASGKWTLKSKTELKNGVYDIVATVTDGAGKSLTDATKDELTVDVPAPVAPAPAPAEAAPLPAPTVTSSTSDSDHPVVKGTWPAGIAKSLVVDLDGVKHKLGTDFDLLSDAAGNWTLKPAKPVVNGTYDVVATVSDGAGKSVSDTTKNELTVNVAAPKPAPATGTYDCEGTLARIAAVFPVRFDTAKWNLVTPFDAAVNQYVALLKDPRCAAMKVQVTGHADERGSEAYNMGLSENRAKTVIDALVKAGVDGARMNAVGMGKTKPLDPSHTPDALRKNRRVEFTVAK